MAHLLRLIAVLAFFLAGHAHASFPPQPTYFVTVGPSKSENLPTRAAACTTVISIWGGLRPDITVKTSVPLGTNQCQVTYVIPPSDNEQGNIFDLTMVAPSCPVNSTGGTTCTCNAGFAELSNQCLPGQPGGVDDIPKDLAEECKAGKASGRGVKIIGTSTGSTPDLACYLSGAQYGVNNIHGCAVTVGDSVAVPNANGTRSWSGTGTYTGGTCTEGTGTGSGGDSGTGGGGPGTDLKGPRVAENPCPKGFPGQVNGADVCVPVSGSNGVDSTVKNTSTNPDGSKSEVVEETKCAGGVCTTTTTTNNYNSSGVSTGTTRSTSTESLGAKCAKSPANKVCTETGTGSGSGSGSGSGNGSGTGSGGDSSFSGSCAQGFKAVSEDAVINAMAEETYRQNCKMNPDADSQKEGKAAYDANEKPANMTKDNPNNSEQNIGPSSFNTSNAIGGGACIADKSVAIAGKSFTLPLSSVCQYLEVLGGVLLACSFLLAARIVTRG